MKFNANAHQIRRTRKVLQWTVVPMALLAVLTLSSPILPLLLCFLALATCLVALWVGVVEEQVTTHGSSWVYRSAMGKPRRVVVTQPTHAAQGDYRHGWVEPEAPKTTRQLHWLTWVVVLIPVAVGGKGLGWRLFKREVKREWAAWTDGKRERLVTWLEAVELRQFIERTKVKERWWR
jgi:hypothetical protein